MRYAKSVSIVSLVCFWFITGNVLFAQSGSVPEAPPAVHIFVDSGGSMRDSLVKHSVTEAVCQKLKDEILKMIDGDQDFNGLPSGSTISVTGFQDDGKGGASDTETIFDYIVGSGLPPNFNALGSFKTVKTWGAAENSNLMLVVAPELQAQRPNRALVIISNSTKPSPAGKIVQSFRAFGSALYVIKVPAGGAFPVKSGLLQKIETDLAQEFMEVRSMNFGNVRLRKTIQWSIGPSDGNWMLPVGASSKPFWLKVKNNTGHNLQQMTCLVEEATKKVKMTGGSVALLPAGKDAQVNLTMDFSGLTGRTDPLPLKFRLKSSVHEAGNVVFAPQELAGTVEFEKPKPPVPAPKAQFAASPLKGSAPLTVMITNQSQHASSFEWTFGNGEKSDRQDPGKVIYAAPGNYEIALVVKGAENKQDSYKLKVSVEKTPVAPPPQPPAPPAPSASFTIETQPVVAGEPLQLANNSRNTKSYEWDFGAPDIPRSTERTPDMVVYQQPGEYTITLTAYDQAGQKGRKSTSTILVTVESGGTPFPVILLGLAVLAGVIWLVKRVLGGKAKVQVVCRRNGEQVGEAVPITGTISLDRVFDSPVPVKVSVQKNPDDREVLDLHFESEKEMRLVRVSPHEVIVLQPRVRSEAVRPGCFRFEVEGMQCGEDYDFTEIAKD